MNFKQDFTKVFTFSHELMQLTASQDIVTNLFRLFSTNDIYWEQLLSMHEDFGKQSI